MESAFLTEYDLHLLAEGTHYRNYEKLGAHLTALNDEPGTRFAVWAPNAESVSVIGDFNDWNRETHPMKPSEAGVWECFIAGVGQGALYKFHIASRVDGYLVEKADPYAFASEIRPRTASKVWDLSGYGWGDADWMADRGRHNAYDAPISAYEVHLGSWRRAPDEGNRWLSYREVAPLLADYVTEMGFTHVELMPVSEHPFDGSWGYQPVGYFAPTSRFGTPQDFMYLVDTLHQRGIGVIVDWVPAHFPKDEHGLGFFDGTHLYEHADPRQGHHPDWGTLIFNYGRSEVRNFLIGNALFWLDKYHIDGLRVDAVASMLYLDYGREEGEWLPNRYGGRENIEAIDFLRKFNERVYVEYTDAMTIAEESTSWGMVSGPTHVGGLGFGFKWNMGWMNDMLQYMSKDPVHRPHHHSNITFSMIYAFTENFVLPFSHDEVVHGKKSMIGKMPGDEWQKFANLRLLYGFMFGHSGKKLLFMGNEFGQINEWNHDESLEWHVLERAPHRGLQRWVRDLNMLYRDEPSLYEIDSEPAGFSWIDCNDTESSVVSFVRRAHDPGNQLLFACNFTPVPRYYYQIGAPAGGYWQEVLNSDSAHYGGSDQGNQGSVKATSEPKHGQQYSLHLTLPPLAVVVLRNVR